MLIYLTSDCQLRCKHCFVPKIKPPKELTIKDLEWLNTTFKIKKLNFLGGEPTLYRNLKEAVDVFDKETKITLTTNGIILANKDKRTKELMDIFKSRGENFSVQLSIQGNEDDTDTVRGKTTWRKVMSAMENLKENKVQCFFLCNYNRENLGHLEELIDTVGHHLHIPIVFFPEVGVPQLTIQEQAWFFSMIVKKNDEYNSNNLIDQPHFYEWLGLPGRCGAGSERLCLTFNKEITPCHFDLDYILGKVGDTLETINRNRQFFIDTRKKIQPSCGFCKKNEICRSGCYASGAYTGCPLQRNFTIEQFAKENLISTTSLSTQRDNIKGLLKDSLICG